jgi:hypothetical protein
MSAQQLNDTINGTLAAAAANSSANTNVMELLDPNADLATAVAKINELIQAMRR